MFSLLKLLSVSFYAVLCTTLQSLTYVLNILLKYQVLQFKIIKISENCPVVFAFNMCRYFWLFMKVLVRVICDYPIKSQ